MTSLCPNSPLSACWPWVLCQMETPQELRGATAPLGYKPSSWPQLCQPKPWLLRHVSRTKPQRCVAVNPWRDGEGRAFPRNWSEDAWSVLHAVRAQKSVTSTSFTVYFSFFREVRAQNGDGSGNSEVFWLFQHRLGVAAVAPIEKTVVCITRPGWDIVILELSHRRFPAQFKVMTSPRAAGIPL